MSTGRGWALALSRLLAPIGVLLLPAAALADVMIDNINGLTLDAQGRVMRFQAMVISPEGNVVRLLQTKDKRPQGLRWRADFKGRTVMPGFVDAHVDVMAMGLRAMELDLSSARSLEEARSRIAAYAAAQPDRQWILGSGWDDGGWGLGRPLTASDLAGLAGDRPIWLVSADREAGWANAAAIRAAVIGAATVPPAGGRIDKAGGVPSGLFIGTARELIESRLPPLSARDRDAAYLKAQELLLANGVTTATDMGTTLDAWLSYRRMGDQGVLRLRLIGYASAPDVAARVAANGFTPWLYGDRLRMVGVRIATDGSLAWRAAWLKAPYADAAGQSGLPRLTDDQLRNLMVRASMDGFQVAIEANGDRAVQEALDAIADIADTYKGDRRWRIEGAALIDPADLPRFRQNGVTVTVRPGSVAARNLVAARLGPPRITAVAPGGALASNGVPIALGSGSPAAVVSPFAVWSAALIGHDPMAPAGSGALGREQGWAALTIGAARAAHAEDRIGRLAPGYRADFVVLDGDPLLAGSAELREMKPIETWVGGTKMWMRR